MLNTFKLITLLCGLTFAGIIIEIVALSTLYESPKYKNNKILKICGNIMTILSVTLMAFAGTLVIFGLLVACWNWLHV